MQTYETSDYQLAVALITAGYKLTHIDKSVHQRAVFNFKAEHGLHQTVEAFFGDRLMFNPRLILTNARLLKDRLYGQG